MSITVDYFFALSSPWTYLGHQRFQALAKERGLEVNYRPASGAELFPVSGGLPVNKRAPQRQAYRMMELKRWREFLGAKLNLEPKFFPVNDQLAARAFLAGVKEGAEPSALMFSYLRAVWAEERDIADEATVAAIATENGLDGGKILEAAGSPEMEAAYKATTQEAIDRSVFGYPTWIVDGELFWGQDRLELLQRALDKAAG